MVKARLLKLAKFLEKLPVRKFNLGSYTTASTLKGANGLKKPNCKLAGCAVGWCPTVWPNQFKWVMQSDEPIVVNKNFSTDENDVYWVESAVATKEFFGLSNEEWSYLFHPDHYLAGDKTTPQEVASRIEHFAENGQVYTLVAQ